MSLAIATDRGTTAKVGRPRIYNERMAQKLCERIMSGESLNKICESPTFPSKLTVIRWLANPEYKEFRDLYYYARRVQAEILVDDMWDIIDDTSEDWIETFDKHGNPNGYKPNHETAANKRLRVDSIKWYAGKMVPKIYGDHLDVTHDVTGDLAELMKEATNRTSGLPKPISEQ